MSVRPILSALRWHKAAALLIASQIALTLAIVCNAIFIIHSRVERIDRTTGLDERDLLMVSTSDNRTDVATDASKATVYSSILSDLSALRTLPGVADAYETNSLSLTNVNWMLGLRMTPTAPIKLRTIFFDADEHTLDTLGVKLIAGRNFRSDEVQGQGQLDALQPAVIIVSKDVANRLFPDGDALGKQVYFVGAEKPSTIVGVLEKLQSSSTSIGNDGLTWNTTLVPLRLVDPSRFYVIRAKPGRLDEVMKSAPAALYAQNSQRVIPDGGGVDAGIRSFSQIRTEAYQTDRVLALLMGIISMILLAVTAAGIAGLSIFWVDQRKRQIGVRRALGATRADILSYFLTENLLISIGGIVVGAMLAFALNNWLMSQFELAKLPFYYVAAGMLALLLLGQGAAFAPSFRATRISPIKAIRSD